MKTAVIISAHTKARELGFVLAGYAVQTTPPNEIIVTQDGTDPRIAPVIEHARTYGLTITHLTQPHQGFGKCRALNRAIQHACSDLLIFTDGDCIPRNDFVQRFTELIRRGQFLAGGSHINLPEHFYQTHDLTESIRNQSLFLYSTLTQITGFHKSRFRLTRCTTLARALDQLTQRNAFSGANSAAFRTDILAVGGFDESMGYGGEDTNLGIRLNNIGIRGIRARYSLVTLHLDHQRSYADPSIILANKIWNKTIKKKRNIFPKTSCLLI